MASWEAVPPRIYSVVTGFFPETSPKGTWLQNPRPLLVCGTARDPDTQTIFCRIAYGTSQKLHLAKDDDLVIGNISWLNQLGLKTATRFVTSSGRDMSIMPWKAAYFRPWTGYSTPVLSVLPEEMQRHVGSILSSLPDLPKF